MLSNHKRNLKFQNQEKFLLIKIKNHSCNIANLLQLRKWIFLKQDYKDKIKLNFLIALTVQLQNLLKKLIQNVIFNMKSLQKQYIGPQSNPKGIIINLFLLAKIKYSRRGELVKDYVEKYIKQLDQNGLKKLIQFVTGSPYFYVHE